MQAKKPKKTLNQTNLHRNKPDKTTLTGKTGLTTLPDNAVKARSGLLLYGYHSVIAALSNVQRDPIQLFATEAAADKLRTVSTRPLPPMVSTRHLVVFPSVFHRPPDHKRGEAKGELWRGEGEGPSDLLSYMAI